MTLTDVKKLRSRAPAHRDRGWRVSALIEMIREDLVAERIAIDSYLGALRYLGDRTRPPVRCSRLFSRSRKDMPTNSRICSPNSQASQFSWRRLGVAHATPI